MEDENFGDRNEGRTCCWQENKTKTITITRTKRKEKEQEKNVSNIIQRAFKMEAIGSKNRNKYGSYGQW